MIQKYTLIIIQTTDIIDTIIYRIYKQKLVDKFYLSTSSSNSKPFKQFQSSVALF